MSENMLTVTNSEFGKLDILIEDGKELFPAAECAKMLGYSNPKDAVGRHCRSVVKRDLPHPQSQNKKITVNFIPEGDVWRLIIRSRLPSAQKFEKWLFDEVLPELRRTGEYRMGAAGDGRRPVSDLPHSWMGRPCIRIEDAAKRMGVKRGKVNDLLRSKPTVYLNGEDWETLRGNELNEFKFCNRVGAGTKGLMILYESGIVKLLWELHGIGSAEEALGINRPGNEQLILLPEAVEKENAQMRRRMARIAKIVQEQ